MYVPSPVDGAPPPPTVILRGVAGPAVITSGMAELVSLEPERVDPLVAPKSYNK